MSWDQEPKCPHCGEEYCTDEGPYADGEEVEVDWCECGKEYVVRASVAVEWETQCLKGEHAFVNAGVARNPDYHTCTRCSAYYFADMPSSKERVGVE